MQCDALKERNLQFVENELLVLPKKGFMKEK
jgi:hypothetical protein